jgi:hypothetical protein
VKEPRSGGSAGAGGADPTPAEYEEQWGSPQVETFNTIMKSEKYGVPWQLDAEVKACNLCQRSFTLTVRRHHCRKCGGIVCDTCSESRLFMEGSVNKKRACDACVQDVTEAGKF